MLSQSSMAVKVRYRMESPGQSPATMESFHETPKGQKLSSAVAIHSAESVGRGHTSSQDKTVSSGKYTKVGGMVSTAVIC